MNNLILQPAGNADAREHYLNSVNESISIDSILNHLSSEQAQLLYEVYPSGKFKCWGVTPSNTNINKWNRVQSGDVTLFARQGKIFAKATTTVKFQNRALALELWKTNKAGDTWEYMYFLDEVEELEVPYSVFNKIIGYEDNYVIQGFNVLRHDKARKVFDTLGLWSNTFYPDASEEEFRQAILQLEETEAESQSKVRLEQGYLRRFLFGNKVTERCSCCGETFPVSMLVTAHIKPRKNCSHDEKLDKNIVIPMCKFGCDELFEKGIIVVKDSKIQKGKNFETTDAVEAKISVLVGRELIGINSGNEDYFEWHRRHHCN